MAAVETQFTARSENSDGKRRIRDNLVWSLNKEVLKLKLEFCLTPHGL